MVSSTQQFSRIRRRKQTTNGKWNKRARRRLGTPAFPVHPAGYDVNAADAKKAEKAGLRESSWPTIPQQRSATDSD